MKNNYNLFLFILLIILSSCGGVDEPTSVSFPEINGETIPNEDINASTVWIGGLQVVCEDLPYKLSYYAAKNACKKLRTYMEGNVVEKNPGWRLPTKDEWKMIKEFDQQFASPEKDENTYYWTRLTKSSGYLQSGKAYYWSSNVRKEYTPDGELIEEFPIWIFENNIVGFKGRDLSKTSLHYYNQIMNEEIKYYVRFVRDSSFYLKRH